MCAPVPADRIFENFQMTWPSNVDYQHDASALSCERDPEIKKPAGYEPATESRTSVDSNSKSTTRSQEVQTTLTIAKNIDEHEILIQHQPRSLRTKNTSRIKSYFQLHEGAWTIVHRPPRARPHQTSNQKSHTTFRSRDTAHVNMARTVARILSKKYHRDTALTLKPWKRTIWNMITNSRNLHPVYAHHTQLRSMILIPSEDKACDTLANEEALDFGLILVKHMSLLPQEVLELSMDPQSSKEKSSPSNLIATSLESAFRWQRAQIVRADSDSRQIFAAEYRALHWKLIATSLDHEFRRQWTHIIPAEHEPRQMCAAKHHTVHAEFLDPSISCPSEPTDFLSYIEDESVPEDEPPELQ